MRYGAIFPQTEIGTDPIAIRDYAQAVEGLGYDYLLAYDHVLGADPEGREGRWPYTYLSTFHEPFALFSYLAGLTERIEFISGVIISAAAPDGARREAGGRGRHSLGWAPDPRHRQRLELPRVRVAGRGLPHSWATPRGAGRDCCGGSGRSRSWSSRATSTASPPRASTRGPTG